ncbi:SDR family oxidoreductase [Vibrio hippocampi]|uniref:3-phenylpropionate-dihydrodiol/cinnamic acid-dihydrodiol dehydrogenase n=1 Tax=Vibrio hippocampi TaxID=654686 RepID=A0ABM8ZH56_9VIBR|nr:SDR family oxidoreductase [Vibrio hippocampi]CAH0525469.1 3-phenylpropionate-dihydrodiol/cinnamic acid-dihydrodiol dehydrogenase [Vibrio hippocampi]
MTTVFITGANRGIGLALTRQYLDHDFDVYASYRDINTSQDLIAMQQQYTNLTLIQFDVTDYASWQTALGDLPNLDIFINNAGYYGPKGYGFGHTDIEEWRKVFEINTIAPLKLVEFLYPKLLANTTRKIACLSSKVGSMTENTSGGGYIYRSSKAALNSVVKSLSNDLRQDNFTVLALHPGWVQTEMGGPNALITTETSVNGLYDVIANSHVNQSGKFINYDGQSLPW